MPRKLFPAICHPFRIFLSRRRAFLYYSIKGVDACRKSMLPGNCWLWNIVFGFSILNIVFTLSKLRYKVKIEDAYDFDTIMLWHQRNRNIPELHVSWNFLALEHRFSDSAPQIQHLRSKAASFSKRSKCCDIYTIKGIKALIVAGNQCFLDFFASETLFFRIQHLKYSIYAL